MITGGGRNDYWRNEGGLLGEGGLNTMGRRVYYWRWKDKLERMWSFLEDGGLLWKGW